MNSTSAPFYPQSQNAVQFPYSAPAYLQPSADQASPYYRYSPSAGQAIVGVSQDRQQNAPFFRPLPPQQQQQQQQRQHTSAEVSSVSSHRQHGSQPQPPDQLNISSRPVDLHAASHLGHPPPGYFGTGDAPRTGTLRNEHGQNDEDDEDNDAVDGNRDADENEPIFHLPPPPEETYPNEGELEKSLHAWSLEHGYELVKRASKKNAQGQLYKRYYHCSKHGSRTQSKLTDATRKRANRKSNRTGCPMSIASVAAEPSNPKGPWQIRHRKTHHNHGPLDGLELAGHRRRARGGDVETAVDGLFAIGTTTTQVLQFLQKTHPNGLFTRTDVANMKLKWKKFGTCADRVQRQDGVRQHGEPGSACTRCREKHDRCGRERPACQGCVANGAQCTYDGEPPPSSQQPRSPLEEVPSFEADDAGYMRTNHETQAPSQSGRNAPRPPAPSSEQIAKTQEILSNLQTFQQSHMPSRKLQLTSSSVEVLAQSSCGTGNSYGSIPVLAREQDWPGFRDAVIEAARRENHYEVLIGDKVEPSAPSEPTSNQIPTEIEDWNEYIRQLAIFNRRNDLLLAALSGKLAPNFRNHIRNFSKARQAWSALDEICLPRGSQHAYSLYQQLHSTTLAASVDLNEYIGRLEATYAQVKQLKLSRSSNSNPANGAADSKRPRTGADVLPDEGMCLLFLRNLGPGWKRWSEGLLATNNVAGFGTGQRLGFRDLCRRAVAYEVMQRQNRDA